MIAPSWIAVDPGEDTGFALYDGDVLIEAGTLKGWELIDDLDAALDPLVQAGDKNLLFVGVEKVVCEDWALYPWELRNLSWDKCRTARFIGAIELLCRRYHLDLILQPASIKEAAEAGGAAEYFYRPLHPNRHANDAIRHGFWHLQTAQIGAGSAAPTGNAPTAAKQPPEKPQQAPSDQNGPTPDPSGA